MDTEKDTQEQLYKSRLRLKWEMQKAIQSISKPSKRKLAQEWKTKYSEIFYQELLNCARNSKVRSEIAAWDNERMGKP
jgi:hypothetical protein